MKSRLAVAEREELLKIHDTSLKILNETGVVFDDEQALEIFKKNGIKTEGKIVYIPEQAVEAALKTCPSVYKWNARNESHSLIVGEKSLLGAAISAINVQDIQDGLRSSTMADLIKIMKLHQASEVMDFVNMSIVEPTDIDPRIRHLHLTYETMKNCDKPFIAYNILTSRQKSRELLDMVEIAFGCLDENNFATAASVTPSSPFKYESPSLQTILEFAGRYQPVILSACSLTGITCPVDLAGAAIQQNVEVLAGMVFTQLVNPGTPVVYHASNNVGNLRFGTSAWGSPESVLMNIPNYQLAMEIYNLPVRAIAGVTTARTLGLQAVMETMQSVMMSRLTNVHLIYCCCGVLDNIMTYSCEKQIIDEEIYSRADCVADGISFSDSDVDSALDTIQDVAHKEIFLTHKSTFKCMRERWEPSVSVWRGGMDSQADILSNARRIVKERLDQAPETLLDPELDKDLTAFINKKSMKI